MSAEYSLFDRLVEHKDILDRVLFDFLSTKDLVAFDSAAVHRDTRNRLHAALVNVRYAVPFNEMLPLWWKHHKAVIRWFVDRGMYHTVGHWHVNQRLWDKLLADESYAEFVTNLRGIRFVGLHDASAFFGLQRCRRLVYLELVDFPSQGSLPAEPLDLPFLRELRLHNFTLHNDFLHLFSSSPSLSSVCFFHMQFVEDVQESLVDLFLQNLKHFSVVGDVDGFLKCILKKPVKATTVSIDRMHKEGIEPVDLSFFLQCIPEVRDLTVERMRLHSLSFFKCLTAYNANLRRLHLNHIRLSDSPTACPDVSEVRVSVSSLQISTLLPSNDENVLDILNICRTNLTDLSLSFCTKMTLTGLATIARGFRLLSVEIVGTKKFFETIDPSGQGAVLVGIFEGVPKLSISMWPTWKSEREKEFFPHQRVVIFEK